MPPAADTADAVGWLARIEAHLAEISVNVRDARDYLGGIYGVLQSQEGLASGLGELAPMVMAAMLGQTGPLPGGPHAPTVIEGEPVGT